MSALWSVDAMAAAMRAERAGALPQSVGGLSIDSRTVKPGEAFFAIAGEARDGHDFVEAALKAGAALAVVSAEKRNAFAADAPLLAVADVLEGLRDLAAASRARTKACVIGVTGSVGKTSTKEALRVALSRDGLTHASVASYNNHWGVPLSLARCPQDARYAGFDMGMNHAGAIAPLSRLVRPHVAIITTVGAVHLEYFRSLDAIADAKAEILEGLEPGGAIVLNRDIPQFARLSAHAKAAGARVVAFGEDESADARLIDCALQPASATVHATILGTEVTYKLGAPGRHMVLNSLAVLAAVSLTGADLALAALALAGLAPASGRGTRIALHFPNGTALLIDESYNANPASMRAALDLLGLAPTGPRGRRVAVLGDMLELGAKSAELHRALVDPILANKVDLVFCAGPAMEELWRALPSNRRGGYAENAKALEPQVLSAIVAGDAVMVKGSNGSKMTPIVRALERQFAPSGTLEDASAQG
jgi:UDP-N-acetylmuramoyl-tripeptide--D-alanyl-D-alanine ligase